MFQCLFTYITKVLYYFSADLLKGFFAYYCGHEKDKELESAADSDTKSERVDLETQALITGWENPRAVDREKLLSIPGYDKCKVNMVIFIFT